MAEYALVGPADEIKAFARDVNPDVNTKAGWRWLPVMRTTDPCDPATQILEPESIEIAKDRVVVTRAARPMTPEELEQQADARLDEALAPSLLAVLAELENRIRALEGKPERPADEFRHAVRRLFA